MFRPRGFTSLVGRPRTSVRLPCTPRCLAVRSSWPDINQLNVLPRPATKLWESTTTTTTTAAPATPASSQAKPAAEKDDGHIDVKSNESILFLDSMCYLLCGSIISHAGMLSFDG